MKALVQIMAWRHTRDKPLSEPLIVSLLAHICVIWPQWVNNLSIFSWYIAWQRCSAIHWPSQGTVLYLNSIDRMLSAISHFCHLVLKNGRTRIVRNLPCKYPPCIFTMQSTSEDSFLSPFVLFQGGFWFTYISFVLRWQTYKEFLHFL